MDGFQRLWQGKTRILRFTRILLEITRRSSRRDKVLEMRRSVKTPIDVASTGSCPQKKRDPGVVGLRKVPQGQFSCGFPIILLEITRISGKMSGWVPGRPATIPDLIHNRCTSSLPTFPSIWWGITSLVPALQQCFGSHRIYQNSGKVLERYVVLANKNFSQKSVFTVY